MGEAMLRDGRGCTAQSRRAHQYWTQTLTCATAPRRQKATIKEDVVERSKFLRRSRIICTSTKGATPSGVTRKCCASLTRNAQSDGCRGGLAASAGGGPDQGARGAGPRDTLHGTPSRPNHPPQAPTLDVGTLQPPGTNGRDNTPLDARRCCSRGIICERACARTC